MNMPIQARDTVTGADRWSRFLDDMDTCAGTVMPLKAKGKLIKVAGLVLEAAGLRLPVGAVCEIHSETRMESTLVLAEVVGFTGDRAFLMPTAEVHGLSSGARVVPRTIPINPHSGPTQPPFGVVVKTAPGICPLAAVCWAGSSTPRGSPWIAVALCTMCEASRWCAVPSMRWTVILCACPWIPGCAPSTRC